MSDRGLAMMLELVLEDGRKWGDIAISHQLDDAIAIFSPERPNLHFITRPRGGGKTGDAAGIALSWLAADAPPRARGYVIAANSTQAALLIDAGAGLLVNTPELEGVIFAENERLINADNGAWVRILPMSDSGAWGLRNAQLLVCDEFAQWPETRGAMRVWKAVRSTVQKVAGCRLIVLTSAGEPSHWSYAGVYVPAINDTKNWRVSAMPGPVPWQDEDDLEALRRELLPSEYDRLVLNRWSESEDRAISPEDYEAASEKSFPHGTAPPGVVGGGARLHFPTAGMRYIVTVDIGTRNDATVLCVAHAEHVTGDRRGPKRVVVDHLERWKGSKRHHVEIDAVRDRVLDLASEYNRAKVYADPDQFVGSVQSLNRRGIHAEEWRFSTTSVGQVATALVQTFRNGLIRVPHTDALRDELLTVRLRESAPGVTRLDHDRGSHDDQAVAIGMACHILVGNAGFSSARAFIDATRQAQAITESKKSKSDLAERTVREIRRRISHEPRQVRKCAHRWRGTTCVFCGEVGGDGCELAASSASASTTSN